MLGVRPNTDIDASFGLELSDQEYQTANPLGEWVGQGGDAIVDSTRQNTGTDELRCQQRIELVGGDDCSERAAA